MNISFYLEEPTTTSQSPEQLIDEKKTSGKILFLLFSFLYFVCFKKHLMN